MTSDDRHNNTGSRDHDASMDRSSTDRASADQPGTDQRGEIVQSTVPGARPDVIDVPDSDPHNPTPTEKAAKLQQEVTGGLIPDNEDG